MAYNRRFWVYPVAALFVAAIIIGATQIYMHSNTMTGGGQTKTTTSVPAGSPPTSSTSAGASYSPLAVVLTDPPQVPAGTVWLNVTFTKIALLVGEPAGSGGQSVTTVTVVPAGGSSTIDLLQLQNYTKVLAVANLTQGSVVYSVTFTVASIKIDINGTQYNVTLAGNSGTLQAVIANPKPLAGSSEALIELNPVVVRTPSGYQLIPSTVAVVAPSKPQQEGSVSKLSSEEEQELQEARGNLTVKVLELTAKGNLTTFVVLVNNTGNVSVQLVAISLHGDFNVTGSACKAGEHGKTNHTEGDHGEGDQQASNQSTGDHGPVFGECEHPDEVVFVPENTTHTTTNNVTVYNLSVVGGREEDDSQGDEDQQGMGITVQPGQAVKLVFNGTITFGESNITLVPSLTAGSTYTVHVIASNGAEQKLSCSVPVGPATCAPTKQED